MKAIHTKSQPNLSTKDERISTRENPVSNSISSNSSSIHDSSSFAPRRANKLKEFFGLFSIHNKLPQTRGGGTSLTGISFEKETPTKKTSTIFETKVNSISKFDNKNSVPEFNSYRGKNKSTLKNYIRFNRNIRLVGSLSVIMLMFIATGIVVPYYIKSNNSEATAGQAIGSTLTFSAESLTASVSLSNLAKDGTFATSGNDEQAKFSIATDNFTGYTLTMRTSDGNALKSTNPTTNTDTFTSITSNISASTFSNSANTTYNNQWGIIPNYYYSNNATIANTDTYLKVPATNESITLDVTSAKNTEAKNYTIGIGARADYTNKIDTYSNTFILEYIANPVTYSITYNKNTTDTVNNMPTTNPQTGSTSGGTVNSVNLASNIPTRTGYTFKGWCSVSTSDDTCSGTIYNDQTVEVANRIMNYGIDQTIDNTMVTLNAMWTRNNATYSLTLDANGGTNAPTVNNIINNTGSATFTLPTTIPTYEGYNFLGWCSVATSDNTCSGTTYSYDESTTSFNPSTITLTQNDLSSSTVGATLYAIWEVGLPGIDDIATMQDFASLTAEEYAAVVNSMTTGTSYQLADSRDNNTYNVAKLADGNVWLQDNLRLGATTLTTNLTSANTNVSTSTTITANTFNGWKSSSISSYTAPMFNTSEANSPTSDPWKYGVYYNYCAASANTYCTDAGLGSGNASYDICPAGWRMPTGDTGAYSYYALYTAYSSNVANFKNALRTPLSGYFYVSSASDKGSYGYFWSSTIYDGRYMRTLRVDGSSVNPQYYNYRQNGYSVRCVLKPLAMQNISADALATLLPNNGDTTTLVDNRDGEAYTIGKLNGKYWMLDNLRLGKTSTISLTSSDTNLPSGTTFSLPAGITSGFDQYGNSYTAAQINVASKNKVASVKYGTQGFGKIGVYYNYAAASAGKITGTSNSSNGDTDQDICPAGWRLPTGGPSGEFQALCDAVKGSSCANGDTDANALKLRDTLNLPLSGYFFNSSANGQGSNGLFWSSTWSSNTSMYVLYVDASSVYPQNKGGRNSGSSVRCVLK